MLATVPHLRSLSKVLILYLQTNQSIKLQLGISSLCQKSLYQLTTCPVSLEAFQADFTVELPTICSFY
ncbi:hypothetical protein LguiA_023849 [Lonicera macranthoides]